MESDSEEENETLRQLEEKIKQIKEKKKKRKLRKHKNTPSYLSNENNNVSSEKCQKELFPIYQKNMGTVDYGKEYEQVMCAFYALKLVARDDVENFEMTTNNQEYGVFDDISLKVMFKNKTTCTFLFQLKHKEAAKSIKKKDLFSGKRDFDIEKYFNALSSKNQSTEDVHILYTNSPIHLKNSMQIQENITVDVCHYLEYEDLLLNTGKKTPRIFQCTQSIEDKIQKIYFFTEQNNIQSTKLKVEEMLQELLQCNICDGFMHFISEWWSKNFVLNRDDVIAKLTELAVSPYIKTLNDNKKNEKTKYLKEAIMKFPISIVTKTDEDIIENIWSFERISDDESIKAKEKFGLKSMEHFKISWLLGQVPLVVKVDDLNKTMIKHVIKLMNKSAECKKIILVGNVTKGEFEGMEVFYNLSNLISKCKNEERCNKILSTFKMSLQGREPISLEQLLSIDGEFAEHIGVCQLLKMSQTNYIIGKKKEKLPDLHIPRHVSTIFVKTENILRICESQRNQTMVIINCDSTFKDTMLRHKNFRCVEMSEYFNETFNTNENVIIISTKSKCTNAEFTEVCEKSKKLNVYLFQTFDDKSCVLLLRKGNELSSDVIDEPKNILETNILDYFDNPLNVICAPPGMGKSTLMKVIYNNCPSDCWGIYVDLIHHNSFLAKKPDSKAMWNYFLNLAETEVKNVETTVKNILRRSRKMYLYLDGLDEVDSSHLQRILEFVKEASSSGVNIWISSRENLREPLSQDLNVVPIEVQELSKEQQEEYIDKKLRHKYDNEKIDKILHAVFSSADLNKSQQLLGIPLQLHIITEMFLKNDDAYKNIEEKNIFVLTQMYKRFFDGKIASALDKIVGENQTHQIGNIIFLLKQYEVVALKTCLDNEDFLKLNVDFTESEDFIDDIKKNGDKFGIIKNINESDDAVFDHQTYAEYFACVWLKKHKDKTSLLGKVFFSEKYENLRLMFDVLLAEDNPLHLCIIYKNRDQFEKYIHDVNVKDQGGRTPLHLICTYGMKYPKSCFMKGFTHDFFYLVELNPELDWYMFMTKTIAQKQINVNEQDEFFNYSFLNYSLEAKCLYPIEVLLEKNVLNFNDVKKTIFENYDVNTLAYYAAHLGYPNLLSAIIAENPQVVYIKLRDKSLMEIAVIGSKDKNKKNPLEFENYNHVIKLLIEKGIDVNAQNNNGTTALQLAIVNGKYEITKMLLKYGASINTVDIDNQNALHYASDSSEDNREIIKLLIEKGIDVNAQNNNGTTALQLASENGVYENTKILLEYGASINSRDKDNKNALHYASDSWVENVKIIKLLIEKGIDVNAQNNNGTTALQLASENGVYENTKILLEYGASINSRDKDNKNALHYASDSWVENVKIIKLLIEKGIAVNAQNNNGTTALQLASENGVYEITKMLLEYGAFINTTDEDNKNALHYASDSWKNNGEIIKLLIEKGIDVNAQYNNGTTALQLAIKNGDNEITKMLLEYGAFINTTDEDNKNALHYASDSWVENVKIIKLLIEKGIDVNAQNNNGTTALQLASENVDYEITKMLLEYGASINTTDKDNKNALHYASDSWKNNGEIIKLLIEKGIDVNDQNNNGTTALHLASVNGDYEITKLLLEYGASINTVDKNNESALHYASDSWKGNREMIKLLIEKGIDVNAKNNYGTTALQLASAKGVYENTKMLLEYGASVNTIDQDNKNALHYASYSWKDNREIIKLLIEKGIDVNAQNNNGTTALQLASIKGVYENTKMLLEYGASINTVDNANENPLHYASYSWKENREIIKLLIEKGIDVNAQNNNGTTALQLASVNADYENTKRLLKYGASINTVDNDNENPLHYASDSSKDNREIIKLLFEKGIDVNAKNIYGTTALQLASAQGVYENTKMLLEYCASINTVDNDNENSLHNA